MKLKMASSAAREYQIRVPAVSKRERLDIFLTSRIANVTRTKVQKAIEQGFVLVNGKKVKSSYRIAPNDDIQITLPAPPAPEAKPENIPLNIVYEDDDVIVLNKPAGMVTHPAYGNYSGTLVNALLYHTSSLSTGGDLLRPGIIHRLDKDTSGLLVVAKNDYAHAFLGEQFARRTIDREYWAVVWGVFGTPRGEIEAEIGRSVRDRKKMAVIPGGKSAVTEYTVLETFSAEVGLTLLRLRLRTGRTHQIRVHLSHIGHPVFGDPAYGGRRIAWGSVDKKRKEQVQELLGIMKRQALHAKTLGFIHPATKQYLHFDSELPEDFRLLLERLRALRV
ncbi:MAG: RluA family pseudouridine synthase [Bacteroidota bacterium]